MDNRATTQADKLKLELHTLGSRLRTFGVQASACLFLVVALALEAHAQQPARTYGNLTYPAKGNFHLDEGTLELYVTSGFDFEEKDVTYGTLFDLIFPDEKWHYVIMCVSWSHGISMVGYTYPQQSYVSFGRPRWKPGESHVVQWTWSGRKRTLLMDGKGKSEGKGGAVTESVDVVVEGNLQGDLTKALLMVGLAHSNFTIDEIRISSIARTPEELEKLKDTAPVADAHTLLLDHCDGGPAEVISGRSGETGGKLEGSYKIVDGKYGKAIQLWKEKQ